MTPSLLDPGYHALLPTPLAHAARVLARETLENGEHTTADELVTCIEALFGLLGRLWIAEYLAVGAPDAAVNRSLHDRVIARHGPVLGGTWIAIAREVREAFLRHGLAPAAGGLLDFDVGMPGDAAHPVARLSAYRNSFAHGSFHAVLDDIRAHRTLLEAVLARLPFLVEQPFLLDTGSGVVALRGAPEAVARPDAALIPGHPTLLGPGGRTVDLAPLAVGQDATTGTLGLSWPGRKDPGVRDIVKHVRFQAWLERYQRELAGHVEASATCLGAPVTWPEAQAGLAAERDVRGRGLLLLETAPGAPRSGVLAAWADAHGAQVRWSVETDGLLASGLVLTRSLLRATERSCGLRDGSLSCPDGSVWREALAAARRELDSHGPVVRVAIDNLHLGERPAQPGEPSVQDVWRALAGGPFLALGGAVRHWSLRPLAWDARVSLGWPVAPVTMGSDAQRELSAFFEARCVGRRGAAPLRNASPLAGQSTSTLGLDVLEVLRRAKGASLDLFAVCDALEAAGGPDTVVFEPEVERALWDLAPILRFGRAERPREDAGDGAVEHVRTFSILDAGVVDAALETLA
jgi:hypothetical protein